MRSYGSGKKHGPTTTASITWGERMTDDHQTPDERSMNDKILRIMRGDGEGDGLTLTPGEVTAFNLMMGAMHQQQVDTDSQLTIAQGVNRAMIEAITRQGFQLTHIEHDDGSVTYDLENATAETVN